MDEIRIGCRGKDKLKGKVGSDFLVSGDFEQDSDDLCIIEATDTAMPHGRQGILQTPSRVWEN